VISEGKGIGKYMIGNDRNPEKTKYMLLSRCQKAGQRQSIKIANSSFEDVADEIFGNNTNRSKLYSGEIKSRLNSGNACYHSVQILCNPACCPGM
jgi:hypothetical protein